MNSNKLLGGILLVVGTTIGAGMLALPIATAQLGFWGSTFLLVGCWALMTACAFVFLEVNLWLPPNSNLISMAGATLGRPGQVVAWVFYLTLLYSILCAYVAGGGDLFSYLLTSYGLHIHYSIGLLLFTLLFGGVVYLGIRFVDYVNRGLMFGKMGAFILLVLLILPFVSHANLHHGEFHNIVSSSSIMITAVAFTCSMIIPSLRTYFHDDVRALRKAIFFGTLIPLICYIAWDLVIMGVVPLDGLKHMLNSATTNSDLVASLSNLLQKNTITFLAKFFTSICMATSFLSISLCLSDFLSDGLNITKQGKGNLIIYGLTFIPPILIVLFYPKAFLGGLKYAGICCFILMVFLPPLMAWFGRKRFTINSEIVAVTKDGEATLAASIGEVYQVWGGRSLLIVLLMFSILMIILGIKGII